MSESPLKTHGPHLLVVYNQGLQAETLDVTVDGSAVSISGPMWHGEGVVVENGDYIGIAYLRAHPFRRAFHRFAWNGNMFVGFAFYQEGTQDALEWVPGE